MDLSHSSRHLPGRLAVLVLCDGDKTPVWAPRLVVASAGERISVGWEEEDRAGGDGFPETLRCSAINSPTHGLK